MTVKATLETGRLGRVGRARRALPQNVRALGWVSFANDFASELIYPVLPLFLTITLGAPVAILGLIEGVAEGVAVGLRGVAGWLSDRAGERRRPWIVAGYALSALARSVIAAAPAWGYVLGGRLGDRLGKAARTAPRDALIRDSTPAALVGASFGYHRAMDTAGAVVGPLVAVGLLASGWSLRTVLWVAVLPGLLTLLLLTRVREAPRREETALAPAGHDLRLLPRPFWLVLAVWTLFSLGNSSDVFLILRAHDLGLSATLVILAYALYNLVYSALSWPLGALSDRVARSSKESPCRQCRLSSSAGSPGLRFSSAFRWLEFAARANACVRRQAPLRRASSSSCFGMSSCTGWSRSSRRSARPSGVGPGVSSPVWPRCSGPG